MNTNIRNQFTQRRQALEGNCPYCDQVISEQEQQGHLDYCEVYESLMQRFSRASIRSRIYTANVDSLLEGVSESDEDMSLRYLQSSLSSSLSDLHHPQSSSENSRASTPEFTSHKCAAACPVCFNDFSLNVYPPLVLPMCGHTVCSHCLTPLISFM